MKRGAQEGFAPVYAKAARALVLGSYPSPKSFEFGFYYGHPRNRFWPLLANLAERPIPQSIAQKKALVVQSGLALWDALKQCEIEGASDASIKNAVPNPIDVLLQSVPIEAVFCNGAASHRYYTRYCQPLTAIPAVLLPSTSPANAAFSLQRLVDAWAPLKEYILLA